MPTTTPAPPLDDVVAAVAVLRDPALPGKPWTVAEIAAVLPLLAEGPSALAVEAWGARMLHAAVEEQLTPPPAARAGGHVPRRGRTARRKTRS